ncbi:MAG: hypothetical protein AMXMBFR6_19480 [Betaproteobacteria bacterium]
MGAKRKQHSAQFKAQVAMAALAGDKSLAELASEYGVHPTMISTWKQELVKNAKDLFERGNKKAADPQAVIDPLAPQDRPVADRKRFLGRTARHCPPSRAAQCFAQQRL